MLVRTNIYLPKQTIEKLKRKAKEQKTTMSEIVRSAVDKQEREDLENSNAGMMLLKMAQKAHKGEKRDITKNLDYYIYIEPFEKEQKRFLKEMKRKQK